MKGIELSKKYYEQCGKPMLEKQFAGILPQLAVGIAGSGSERFGYDDELSHDHDFEPCFMIFLPGEDVVDRRTEFLLQRAYDKLPHEFCGFTRQIVSPVGGARSGAIRMADFFTDKVGSPTGELSLRQWATIPDSYLAEAVNGDVFYDGRGELTNIRDRLSHMPEDVLRKKLAGALITMAQSGQYNYNRCLAHGEPEAAQLALGTFVQNAARAFFLLNDRYMPFYKWAFRAMRDISGGEKYAQKLASLLSGDVYDKATCGAKCATIEDICAVIADALAAKGLTCKTGPELERHAYSVNDGIKDGELRNMSIFL